MGKKDPLLGVARGGFDLKEREIGDLGGNKKLKHNLY